MRAFIEGCGISSAFFKSLIRTDRASRIAESTARTRSDSTGICRRAGMAEADIGAWVDLRWTCAAAMLEAGVMDEAGEWIPGKDWRRGLAAYREKVAGT
jgi:hypothetical protein